MTKNIKNTSDNEEAVISAGSDRLEYPVNVEFMDLSRLSMRLVRWHWHEELEVIIVNHGTADFLIDDNTIRLTPGQGIVVNQNVMHAIHSVDEESCTFYSVLFHPSFLFGYGTTILSAKYVFPVLNDPSFRILLLEEKNSWEERLTDAVNRVIAVNLARKYGYELVTKEYLCRFWSILLEHTTPPILSRVVQSSLSLDESRVKQALLFMQKHYAESLTLEEIADSIHVSKSECCRCFKRSLKLTPFEYLMKFRIFQAACKIQADDESAQSVSSLAMSVGFNSTSYFNKVFKNYLHCTPTEYRERVVSGDVTAAVESLSPEEL